MSIIENCKAHSGSTSFVARYNDINLPHHRHTISVSRLKMNIRFFYLPKDNADRPQGEDAHFVSFAAKFKETN